MDNIVLHLHKSHRHKKRFRYVGLKTITLSCSFFFLLFYFIFFMAYTGDQIAFLKDVFLLHYVDCLLEALQVTVHKRADLICLSVCECPAAHTVSECDRAAHPTRCANHNFPPTVCFSRGQRRKGICKAKNNFLGMSSGAEGEIRSKLSGHRASNSSNMRGCRKSRFTTLTNKNAILQ